ncbi:DNA-directed RNA polymerase subunit delta [Jeotgalibacillus marinus]|uniref:Probable DNA-directed RNA polymerase subunit delta n=1 Tax=Jeotgalibacillus marinus TaxID=86667 RepID=A0ABV3Q0V0_9BACL
MELKNLSKEELREYSFIEITHYLLVERHEAMSFHDMLNEWKKLLGYNDKEMKARMVQFYTDLNVDGRFISLGENKWGLRTWYPLDQVEDEQVTSEIQTKKKKKTKSKAKKKKAADEDLDFDNLDDKEDDLVYDESEDADDEDDFDEELVDEDEYDLDEDEDEDADEDEDDK